MKKLLCKSTLLAILFAMGPIMVLTGCKDDDEPQETVVFGNPTYSATTMKVNEIVSEGKITIPYQKALGSEAYDVRVSISGVAAEGFRVFDERVELTSGSGEVKINVYGLPKKAGEVTFTINGISRLRTNTVTAIVASEDLPTPPVLAFGTPSFTATKIQALVPIEGGKITIPYTNAVGTEQYAVNITASGVGSGGIIIGNENVTLHSGSGKVEIDVTGTPTTAGNVLFTIDGIAGLSVKTVTATVADAPVGYTWYLVGKATGKYELKNVQELKQFAHMVNGTDKTNSGQTGAVDFVGETVKIADTVTELDLNNEEWTPIGNNLLVDFKGTFDGNNKDIKNLRINQTMSSQLGFFGQVSAATVKNVRLVSGSVSGRSDIGGIIGRATDESSVIGCVSKVTVVATHLFCGGMAGTLSGTVIACENYGEIKGGGQVGGMAGSASTAIACTNHANIAVTGTTGIAGGIVGSSSGKTHACLSKGDVIGDLNIGGVIGMLQSDEEGYSHNYFISSTSGLKDIGGGKGTATTSDYTTINGKVSDLNSAITTWNAANPTKTCMYRYAISGTDTLPSLLKQTNRAKR